MTRRPVIALLTDFGTRDPFVGLMKAAIVARCADAQLVDLTHEVPPQSVAEGAFWLARSAPYLPKQAIVVAVVDPGVGTSRRGLVLEAGGLTFVGPDNGLLSPLAHGDENARAYAIDPVRLGLPEASATFHGRDVFAPVAADLAVPKYASADVGPRVTDLVPSVLPVPRLAGAEIHGEVVTVDRFGNLLTNIGVELLKALGTAEVLFAEARLPIVRTYGEVAVGQAAALVNAFGVLELAERNGNAAESLGAGPGVAVVVRPKR